MSGLNLVAGKELKSAIFDSPKGGAGREGTAISGISPEQAAFDAKQGVRNRQLAAGERIFKRRQRGELTAEEQRIFDSDGGGNSAALQEFIIGREDAALLAKQQQKQRDDEAAARANKKFALIKEFPGRNQTVLGTPKRRSSQKATSFLTGAS